MYGILKPEYLEEGEYIKALNWLKDNGVNVNVGRLMFTHKNILHSKKTELEPDEVWALSELDDSYRLFQVLSEKKPLPSNTVENLKK